MLTTIFRRFLFAILQNAVKFVEFSVATDLLAE